MTSRFLVQIVLLLLLSHSVVGAPSVAVTKEAAHRQEAGLPLMQNFRAKDYHGLPQNWAIIQDRRGVMYFGNSEGILVYDGSMWQKILLLGQSGVYSLALDEHGQIFVGGNSELGFLAPDAHGQLRYVSLLEHVPAPEREFGRISRIVATAEGIFFQTSQYLLRLRKASVGVADSATWSSTIWKPDISFYRLHFIQNQILVSLPQKLLALHEDSLHEILNHAKATNAAINLMLPYPEKTTTPGQQDASILIGTRSEGLFLYDGVSLIPFKCEANTYLRENNLYHGAVLPDGRYVLGTLWGGVEIIDSEGHLLQIINKAAGLHNENILHVFPDREGGLWLGTDGGIARVEISTPLSFFQESLGLTGQLYRIIRHRGRLYVGTSSGLAYLAGSLTPGLAPVFKFVPEMQAQTRGLLSDGESLLVGGNEGLYRLDKSVRSTLIDKNGPDSFLRSKKDPRRIFVGLENGLAVLQSVAGKQQTLVKFPGIYGDVRYIAEDTTGSLWVAERPQGLSRIEVPAGELTPATAANVKIERFGPTNGLPTGWIDVYDLHDRVIIATSRGLRRFEPTSRTFPPDSSFGAFFADTNRTFHFLTEDNNKQVWMVHGYKGQDEIGVAVPGKDGAYTWVSTLFSRIGEFGYMNDIYADPEQPGVMWLGGEENVVRYDGTRPRAPAVDFPTLVRRVTMKGESVIYGGSDVEREMTIAFANNALRFEYAAPTYDNTAATRYQYYLEGFEQNWSTWTAETKKEYTNLPEGDYRFHLRARNVYDRLSNEGVFAFTILPPWYRTWWAYLSYLLFAGASIFGVVRWRVHALQQKARQLETMVDERTIQVVEQKNQLEEQSRKLQELDRFKSRFFVNISHEFRTPLTLILGPLEKVLRGTEKQNSLSEVQMMHRSAANLLRFVNQLLDLARLESGKMQLLVSRGNLIPCLKSAIAAFESLAKSRNIELHFQSPFEALEVWFNHDHLETIFFNLLSNAFKFTLDGGKISVQLSVSSNQLSVPQPPTDHCLLITDHWLLITVQDSGIGIPADKLPYVFDGFFQGEIASTHKSEGTGLGLSLVRELVELHYGQVEIKSEPGQGTEVLIWLPLGREHLKPEEIQSSVFSDQLPVVSRSEMEIPIGRDDQVSVVSRGGTELPIGQDDQLSVIGVDEAGIEDRESSITQAVASDRTIILVVEDNADMRGYIRQNLEPMYRVLEAEDGNRGVEKALGCIPDLVISDVMMPKMDGYQLCNRLKTDERTSHIPIILLTARSEQKDKLVGLETGADDYLTKPFDAQELLVRIKNLIALRRKLQEKFQQQMVLRPGEIQVTSMDEAFLRKAVTVVEAHLEDEAFSPEDLAYQVDMSRAQFYRKMRALTNQPAGLFIRSIRLLRAADLIKQGAGTITEIAYQVGFSSQPYFSKCFQEYFGMTPKEYKLLNC